jgi:hypothetical protein
MTRKLKMLAGTAAISAVISIAGLGAAQPAGAQVTIQQYKAGFADHFQDQANVCGNNLGASIDPIDLYLSRTPYSPSRAQTVRMFTRIDYLTSSGWAFYKQDPVWQVRTFQPESSDWVLVSTPTFSVARGNYYRVVQFYEWWVNGVRVGTATNLFNQSEYFASWVAPTGTAASYCYIY